MGSVTGRLYYLNGYPGLVTSLVASEQVAGEVYSLHDPSRDLPALDEYEECGPSDAPPHNFERSTIQVEMDEGQILDAWVYVYSGDISGKTLIASGDYLNHADPIARN